MKMQNDYSLNSSSNKKAKLFIPSINKQVQSQQKCQPTINKNQQVLDPPLIDINQIDKDKEIVQKLEQKYKNFILQEIELKQKEKGVLKNLEFEVQVKIETKQKPVFIENQYQNNLQLQEAQQNQNRNTKSIKINIPNFNMDINQNTPPNIQNKNVSRINIPNIDLEMSSMKRTQKPEQYVQKTPQAQKKIIGDFIFEQYNFGYDKQNSPEVRDFNFRISRNHKPFYIKNSNFSKVIKFWKSLSEHKPVFFEKIKPIYNQKGHLIEIQKYAELSHKSINIDNISK